MAVVENDRIDMADERTANGTHDVRDERDLDMMFDWVDKMPVPEGFKVEIVEGHIFMSPQREIHWEIIRRIVRALEDRYGMGVRVLSDVRIDFPGKLNGFAPDVAKLRPGAERDKKGRWSYKDLEFVAEVISRDTALNDYGPKLAAYATAGVPVYLVADPYTGRCIVYTDPKQNGEYDTRLPVDFGEPVDLKKTPVDLVLQTDEFPRD
ncbi:Uma2 family endonuclease [Streptomyces alkaliterrae]|uniref:Uma2 family endonuclease n=1 Tax=Streptomyces alkaliterrae TaxID=2213162 RepID=A0A5P0YNQ7_9ACTN|nr:Uma2 family endonuclease [Streptomyces alkaliterrae]MBB1260309.1 Uma2 family endonuclease [Streptomyces alkaliterrae]MQS01984.1 Uma2 family endonuclease [Streptomyces alkaliterrae]